jgi:hypothetical protein
VLIQLYAALIAFVLLKLWSLCFQLTPSRQMPLEYVRQVARHLYDIVSRAEISSYLRRLAIAYTVIIT